MQHKNIHHSPVAYYYKTSDIKHKLDMIIKTELK